MRTTGGTANAARALRFVRERILHSNDTATSRMPTRDIVILIATGGSSGGSSGDNVTETSLTMKREGNDDDEQAEVVVVVVVNRCDGFFHFD